MKSRQDYTAFGEEINSGTGLRTATQGFGTSNNLRQKYGLNERDDATGLGHTWFRKNENQAGRWTSPDPYIGSMSLGDPQSFNRYSYVQNQPTNFVDPSGLNMTVIGNSLYDCTTERTGVDGDWNPFTTTCRFVMSIGGSGVGTSGGTFESGGGGVVEHPAGGSNQNTLCQSALNVAKKKMDAVNRANAEANALQRASKTTGAPAALLAAIGVRESGM